MVQVLLSRIGRSDFAEDQTKGIENATNPITYSRPRFQVQRAQPYREDQLIDDKAENKAETNFKSDNSEVTFSTGKSSE
ncbi:hypothetical protein NPIL_365391 [Nephila pilipes]|uniref:Uncharacterized protein n=1 Tax=Nephila pilipes TaxID=299642 RepID=A0A8X6QP62_NEPPI|nr:hypothetical protein NPIL_365391 [Nephila pilipes]